MIDEISMKADSLAQQVDAFRFHTKKDRRDYDAMYEEVVELQNKLRKIERLVEDKMRAGATQ